ncbi:twin-arginine translocation signal domain-containing protein [Niabella ginsengisoli]|uniref:Twin-arginine translocation signal domain-containing protein n=1 Tax=Niabella ginsengisoli TaxID=522298 RepID=A0ABS9SJM9_9BACT|nr:twin-arginine translocation signal domain-containing protein [Niabella ginsengisoli]MCH5598587.1 twin-arginine translocation signal domain-containing protein [Niabella ginsengisoli]
MEKEIIEHSLNVNRRRFLTKLGMGIGGAALGSLLIPDFFQQKIPKKQLYQACRILLLKQSALYTCFKTEVHLN